MTYPIIPFSSEWEIPVKTKAVTNSTQYGGSGIRQRELVSINPLVKSRDITITLSTVAKVSTMVTFLNENIGKPVRIPYSSSSGNSADDGLLYRYKEFKQNFLSPSCSTFNLSCEQIRRLK